MRFPYEHFAGSPHDIGFRLGQLAGSQPDYKDLILDWDEEELEIAEQNYLKHCLEYTPEVCKEIEGYAEGIDEDFLSVFTEICGEVIEQEVEESCSAFCFVDPHNGQTFLAHNEDWEKDFPLYIAEIEPDNSTPFFCLSYLGQLPGASVVYNGSVAFQNNSIDGYDFQPGVPKTFLFRKFCEMENIDDILHLIKNVPRANANSSMFVSHKEERIVSVEWTIRKVNVEEKNYGFLVHTNHFVNRKRRSPRGEKHTESHARFHFLSRLLDENRDLLDIELIKSWLGNTKTVPYRSSAGQICNDETMASVIVSLHDKKIYIADQIEDKNEYEIFSPLKKLQ